MIAVKPNLSLYFILGFVLLIGCGPTEPTTAELYKLNKKYWDVADYEKAVRLISLSGNSTPKPSYNSPEGSAIVTKLTDLNNLSVVLEDEALGLNHRMKFSEEMFSHYQEMTRQYRDIDREDNFVFARELVDVEIFGLYLQPFYFGFGNQRILDNADNPDSHEVQRVIRENEETLIGNYCIYLDYVKKLNGFSEKKALDSYVSGINNYFPKLIEDHPKANFRQLEVKVKNMIKKTDNPQVISALENIQQLLDNKKG